MMRSVEARSDDARREQTRTRCLRRPLPREARATE
jgi:hypothetical protein